VVHVAADGRLAVNGAAVSPGGLGAVIAGREQAGSVQVKADARTEALAVVRVLEWLREAGIDRVQLVTQARGG
jgi:biopolymer transport protein ExbD